MQAINPSRKHKVPQLTEQTEKATASKIFIIFLGSKGEDSDQNKFLNFLGCTVKYSPLNKPMAHSDLQRC